MPKKRFSSQYSKPPSTVHPSLNSSGPSSSSSSHNDAPPSVNELIHSLRNSQLSSEPRGTSPSVAPTLPPQIRQLLSLPETPPPKARGRRRFDANGRLLPAGPAPPRSWLESSSHAPSGLRKRSAGRLYPHDVRHLPGLDLPPRRSRPDETNSSGKRERSLQDMCMRRVATDWEFIRVYERNNLGYLPTPLRMLLLSNIAVYGPEDGIGFDGLKTVIVSPEDRENQETPEEDNYGFYRLDLSGSVGRSVSLKQLIELVENPVQQSVADTETWEDSLMAPLAPRIPYLTHLSLSHPQSSISWPRLLQFSKYVLTLTHLSLAYWPVPSLTPNSMATMVSSKYGKDVQYGGTNYYSHSLDNDFREAASILRRLASTLYGLEYLDVTGCTEWVRALCWKGDGELGVEWGNQWLKLKELNVRSGIELSERSEFWEVARYVVAVKEVSLVRLMLSKERRGIGKGGGWIDITRDDFRDYEKLWKGETGEEKARNRRHLDSLGSWKSKEEFFHDTVLANDDTAFARSVWDQ